VDRRAHQVARIYKAELAPAHHEYAAAELVSQTGLPHLFAAVTVAAKLLTTRV